MKLAEALCIRAELQKKASQLEGQLKSIAKIQEGDEPSELQNITGQLEELIYRINVTNLHTIRDGEPITRMIARKDVLTLQAGILRNVLKEATGKDFRYRRNEIKYVTTIDTARLRKKIDSVSAELRETDLKIQETNWMTELE